MIDRSLYKLIESNSSYNADDDDPCEGCVLSEYCDDVANELGIEDYMLCAEEEDFDEYENPIYIKKIDEKQDSNR